MLKEALEFLTGLGAKAQGVRVIEVKGVPDLLYVDKGDGEVEELHTPLPPRSHVVHRLDDLIAAATALTNEEHSTLWINSDKVVLMLDDSGRRQNTVRLPLADSGQMTALLACATASLSQAAFIRLLKFDWKGQWRASADLLTACAQIDWSETRTASGVSTRSKESLGRSIEAAVSNVDKIPDEVILTIPVYNTDGARQPEDILCSLEPDLQNQKFLFRAFPGEVDRARERVLLEIAGRLEETSVPAYFGKP